MTDAAFTPASAPATENKGRGAVILCEIGRECQIKLSFSIFFDGTRNNKDEDAPNNAQSNIARLYAACHEEDLQGIFSLYIPGVGTPFPEIGEFEPHRTGASMGTLGAERIVYALLYVANRIAFKLTHREMIPPEQIRSAVKHWDNPVSWSQRLTWMAAGSRSPKIIEIAFDVFGFSRGATAARAFVNRLQLMLPQGRASSVKTRIRFMGLFDTVASVGMADSFPGPGPEGHQGWGDQRLLAIPRSVEQCVHIVAAHEARHSFPVDLVRREAAYPATAPNLIEIVYPGVHSDIGGGYAPRAQGKGTPGLNDGSDRISQITLSDMYRRARKAGVPLRSKAEIAESTLSELFMICPELQRCFDSYMATTGLHAPMPVETQILIHRRFYFGWRKQVLAQAAFARLPSLCRASAQDRVDLIEANDELRRHVTSIEAGKAMRKKAAALAAAPADGGWDDADIERRRAGLPPDPPPAVKHPAEAEYEQEWLPAPDVSATVAEFFERYVHDSRAHFKLTDPQGEWDCVRIRKHLEQKARRHEQSRFAKELAVVRGDPGAQQMIVTPDLTAREREVLEAYRKPPAERGDRPVFSDAAPATEVDGPVTLEDIATGAADRYLRDGQPLLSRRESGWSHLSRRVVFAFSRQSY